MQCKQDRHIPLQGAECALREATSDPSQIKPINPNTKEKVHHYIKKMQLIIPFKKLNAIF